MNQFIRKSQEKLNTPKPEPYKIYTYLNGNQQYEFINYPNYLKFIMEHNRKWNGMYINEQGDLKYEGI